MSTGTSVGQLANMTPEQRTKTVRSLTPGVRLKLAHLASLGIAREIKHITAYQQVLADLTLEEDNA